MIQLNVWQSEQGTIRIVLRPGIILAWSRTQDVQLKKVQWIFMLCADSFDEISMPLRVEEFYSSNFFAGTLVEDAVQLRKYEQGHLFCSSDFFIDIMRALCS